MTNFINQLMFSAAITGPICLMLSLGWLLRRIDLINDGFIDVASKLVFQVTLPALLFLSIIGSEHDFSSSAPLIIFGLIANVILFILFYITTGRLFPGSPDRGVLIQGSYRANTAIIGLAYIANAYGNEGVAIAAVYVAPMTILYNILAVIALSPKGENGSLQAIGMIGKSITKNPLVIAILLGIAFYALAIPVPKMVVDTGRYFANMTLPLALLCTGGSLSLHALRSDQLPTWYATANRLLLAPLAITLCAILLDFRGIEIGIVFFMSGAPTAAASYVMARAMGSNAILAANIIALTTVVSLATCTIGIMLLSSLALM